MRWRDSYLQGYVQQIGGIESWLGTIGLIIAICAGVHMETDKMKVLDLFSGTGSATQAFVDKGHEVARVERNKGLASSYS